MTFEEIKQMDTASAMPTYARYDVALCSGSGATATDVTGKTYIDFGAGIGVNALGYANPGWAQAVAKQAATLQHVSNLYYNPTTVQLTDTLVRLSGMGAVFMANSGAEANECALKLARKYSFDTYGSGRNEILTLKNSFHGRTMTTLTATGQDALHPDCFGPYAGGFSYCDTTLEAFQNAVNDRTCAVVMELIQGEGGVVPLEPAFVKQVCAIAKEKDILVIIDEVQSGVGRTGTFFCYEQYGIKPDIVTLAKGLGGGLPIGACLCAEKLEGVMTPGTHGSTFGGNPVSCAGALYILSQVNDPAFLQQVRQKGDLLKKKIESFRHVKSVSGLGLMLGIELDAGIAGAEVAKRCVANGLIVLTAKTRVRLLPPLNITDDEINKGLAILQSVIENFE